MTAIQRAIVWMKISEKLFGSKCGKHYAKFESFMSFCTKLCSAYVEKHLRGNAGICR